MSAPLDPQIAAIVATQAARGAPRAFAGGIEAARARFRNAMLAAPIDPAVQAMAAPRALPGAPVPARLYVPGRVLSDILVVWFHGGGYALGDLDLFDETARRLAGGLGLRVVAVGYRQAPEFRFPVPFDDALAACLWVKQQAATLGGHPDRVVVAGESSGGNLAASAAILLRDRGATLMAQLLIVPGVNLARDLPMDAIYPMLTAADLADIRDNLVPAGVALDAFPPSPLFRRDLTGVAPAVIATAGHDPLCAEGAAYADRLAGAGVRVTRQHFADLQHQFFGFAGVSTGAARAFDAVCKALRDLLDLADPDEKESTR
ncbi:MAG: alpha/beta hydrolase [Rhodobacteraceae bacterium]|nr:alpha/beta hydrolase [Paracoccaceae bacterium]